MIPFIPRFRCAAPGAKFTAPAGLLFPVLIITYPRSSEAHPAGMEQLSPEWSAAEPWVQGYKRNLKPRRGDTFEFMESIEAHPAGTEQLSPEEVAAEPWVKGSFPKPVNPQG